MDIKQLAAVSAAVMSLAGAPVAAAADVTGIYARPNGERFLVALQKGNTVVVTDDFLIPVGSPNHCGECPNIQEFDYGVGALEEGRPLAVGMHDVAGRCLAQAEIDFQADKAVMVYGLLTPQIDGFDCAPLYPVEARDFTRIFAADGSSPATGVYQTSIAGSDSYLLTMPTEGGLIFSMNNIAAENGAPYQYFNYGTAVLAGETLTVAALELMGGTCSVPVTGQVDAAFTQITVNLGTATPTALGQQLGANCAQWSNVSFTYTRVL